MRDERCRVLHRGAELEAAALRASGKRFENLPLGLLAEAAQRSQPPAAHRTLEMLYGIDLQCLVQTPDALGT